MFLPYVFCDMVQTNEGIDYPMHFYWHEFGMVLVFDEVVDITIKNKDVIWWVDEHEHDQMSMNR